LNPPSGIGFFKNTKNSWKNYTLNNWRKQILLDPCLWKS
jgi:hypothetical protein